MVGESLPVFQYDNSTVLGIQPGPSDLADYNADVCPKTESIYRFDFVFSDVAQYNSFCWSNPICNLFYGQKYMAI